ncbi:alkaline phosphatase [Acinetobacter chinensis]|uniref:Alkaline phosphatase n=1 Tax=Acinetobacter chinensis TaxID=2004650 RepID=A0A3B7LTN7_9GAMM|nr:alkaline phosphatase [Acinetobacter chinensis]
MLGFLEKFQLKIISVVCISFSTLLVTACQSTAVMQAQPTHTTQQKEQQPKRVVFFLGDGMGITTLTASRIYAVGEDGQLAIDRLPESAFVRTFSEDAQVTDSAPSMGAYMTGVKMKNEVISMQTGTIAVEPDSAGNNQCATDPQNKNKQNTQTLLELAKAKGWGTGVVTTTRITHATPASTYAHICHRDAENDIASQLVPSSKGDAYQRYNLKLKDGVDVVLGGGKRQFLPKDVGGERTDGRNLISEMQKAGYRVVFDENQLSQVQLAKNEKLLGLFNHSHLNYDLDRTKKNLVEPSLKQMTLSALDILMQNKKGFFLMVEGGRIDHALHDTNAKRALQDTIALNDALEATIQKLKQSDPELKNTLIVITADHDHTMVLNGYAKRTGKYIEGQETSVLGLVKNYDQAGFAQDIHGQPYPIIGFGTGKKRPTQNRMDDLVQNLKDSDVCHPVQGPKAPQGEKYSFTYPLAETGWCTGTAADDFQQEAVIQTGYKDKETHGGADVFLGAIGQGADQFSGSLENIEVNHLIRKITGL